MQLTGAIKSIGTGPYIPNEREKASFLKENILPIEESGQLKFVDVAGGIDGKLGETSFTENISVRFVNGHTEA